MSPDEHARLLALDPWLRALARHNAGPRSILVRYVRDGVGLAQMLEELRAYLLAQGAQNFGWTDTVEAKVALLRKMHDAPPQTTLTTSEWWARVAARRDAQNAESLSQTARRPGPGAQRVGG